MTPLGLALAITGLVVAAHRSPLPWVPCGPCSCLWLSVALAVAIATALPTVHYVVLAVATVPTTVLIAFIAESLALFRPLPQGPDAP